MTLLNIKYQEEAGALYIFCTGLLLRLKSFCQPLPRISSKSCLGSVIGRISKVSSRILSTFSEKNAGIVGPRYIPFIPRESSVISMHTAFCSYHESTRVREARLQSSRMRPQEQGQPVLRCMSRCTGLHQEFSEYRLFLQDQYR